MLDYCQLIETDVEHGAEASTSAGELVAAFSSASASR